MNKSWRQILAIAALVAAGQGLARGALNINTGTLPAATVTVAYSQTLTAGGGRQPYVWSMASGSLPAGLSLSGAGAITGTPTSRGVFLFTVTVRDGNGDTDSRGLGITVNSNPVITTASLPGGTIGSLYSATLTATGAVAPVTWTITSGSLPPVLLLNPLTGDISGIPSTAGTKSFTVKLTDSGGGSDTQSLTLAITASPNITTSALPAGTVGASYSQSLAASGGAAPYSWTLASGTLPAGLSLSSAGVLSGTPSAAGSSTFSVRVTDSASGSDTASLTLAISPPAVTVTTSTLPGGVVGTAYSQALAASGGTPPYTWSIASGTLPAGLTLSSGGTISGTPTTAGSSTFTVRATASSQSGTASLTLVISPPAVTVTTSTLPGGVVGTTYSQALAASGGTPPYTWSLASGTLPAGLALSSGGTISGTPTTAGSSTFTVRATASSQSGTTSLTLVISPPAVTVTTSTLPGGVVGTAYSQALAASGGTPPYTWSIASGTLPAGLTLSSGGTISGTPTTAGSSTFTVRTTDSASQAATASLSLAITPPTLAVTTSSLPGGTVGTAYSQSLAASGGTPPYSWSLASGTLPAGLSLSTAGTISGTPTAAGNSAFTVRVTDAASQSATASLTLVISPPAVTVTTSTLVNGTVGVAYSQSLAASGGTPPYGWSLASGTLPGGLSLSPAGAISGTPTAVGSSTFVVRATAASSQTATASLTLVIDPPAVTITTSSLPDGIVGAAYSQALGASGGTPPYGWSLASGTLPAGLSLSSAGVLSGTPTTAGSATFSVRVAASSQTATASLTLVIKPPTLAVTTASLPNGTVGTAYSQSLAASGGTPPYSWSIASGTLPAGLSLATGGAISGTPTTAGTSTFTVRATDAASQLATASLTLVISPPGLTVTTSSLPGGTVGTAYSQSLAASGGTAPYSWSIASGTLPAGLSLATGGAISGTPTTAGTSTFTVRATDAASQSATASLTVVISPPGLTVTTSSLPGGTAGTAYSQSLTATGGTVPYSWSLASGTLPAGLSLGTNGAISGTPTTAGTSTFTVRATDAASQTATASLTLAIAAPTLTVTTSSLPGGTAGTAYSQSLTASGGTVPYSWSIASGTLPAGLSLTTGGAISGTPTTAGTSTFTVRATDSTSQTATASLTLAITAPALTVTTATLPGGVVGAAYSQSLAAAGGTTPYTWSLAGGTLPGGLTLAADGSLRGTPQAAGNYGFVVQVADAAGARATRTTSLQIQPSPVQITTRSLLVSTVGVNYSQTLAATGGSLPFSWTVGSGSLPPGLTLDAAGTISGMPGTPGTYSFSLRVSDATGASSVTAFGITINVAVSIETSSLADALIGAPYSQQVRAVGGTPPYTWSVRSGALPDGVRLDAATGTLSGTPTVVGTFTFTLRETDSVAAFAEKSFQIATAAGLIITTAPVLPPATSGLSYTEALTAAGGRAPYIWSISSGGLPAGIRLDASSGGFSGAPSVAGSFPFTVEVTDSVARKATKQFQLAVAAPLVISSAPDLPPAATGTSYSQSIAVTGGTSPYRWSITSGGLPAGLSFDAAASTISGTPTQSGTFAFTLQVVDNNSITVTKQFALSVTSNLLITTSSPLPQGAAGAPYSRTLTASGGVAPYTWTVKSGSLPPGLVLDSPANVITGTPTAGGTFSFTLQVADVSGGAATRDFVLVVSLPPLPSVSIDGLADPANAADQSAFTVSLPTAYPVQLTGQIAMSFASDAAVPLDDATVQFATGGRTVNFTIPAGSTSAVFSIASMALQTGTVAGTITLDLSLQSAAGNVNTTASRTLHVLKAAPVARALKVVRTASGFELQVTGYSTPRQLTQALVQLTPATGTTLQSTQLTIPLTDLAAAWYQSSAAAPFGSQFVLVMPFTIQGNSAGIDSASVSLVNAQGTSAPVSAKY